MTANLTSEYDPPSRDFLVVDHDRAAADFRNGTHWA